MLMNFLWNFTTSAAHHSLIGNAPQFVDNLIEISINWLITSTILRYNVACDTYSTAANSTGSYYGT